MQMSSIFERSSDFLFNAFLDVSLRKRHVNLYIIYIRTNCRINCANTLHEARLYLVRATYNISPKSLTFILRRYSIICNLKKEVRYDGNHNLSVKA